MNVQEFLNERKIPFEVYQHPTTYDAQHLAGALHLPGKEIAKTVLLRANGGFKYLLAVLPATHVVDFEQIGTTLGGTHAQLANEDELAARCPDCEVGVLPPFGSRYGLETLVDESLTDDEQIVFEGNTHGEAIRMRYRDFYELEHPLVARFALCRKDK